MESQKTLNYGRKAELLVSEILRNTGLGLNLHQDRIYPSERGGGEQKDMFTSATTRRKETESEWDNSTL